MPNLDGGHYFLTVLAPIRTDAVIDPLPGHSSSHRNQLAETLALIPTGRQTAASPPDAPPSPFARNTRNHLARFAIIDQPAYNGRLSGNTLGALARNVNPLAAQPVDRLGSPFLLFAVDIDARDPVDAEADLRAYTQALWATMRGELVTIFGHCVDFAGVATADGFHAYLKRCQIETTMPFNDYWADGMQPPRAMPVVAYGAGVGVLAFALAIWALSAGWGWGALIVLLGVAGLGLYAVYRLVLARAARPFPIAPGSDLPSILKALFVQQQFTRLAIEVQGMDDVALHARFGAFLAAVVPPDLIRPTQAPGQVDATPVEWAA